MSHVTSLKIEVSCLDSLKAACAELGLEFVENQKTYRWYGRSVGDYPLPAGMTTKDLGKCDHAIRIPGDSKAYEIGVRKYNGKYTLVWDFYNGGYGMAEKVGGNEAGKLLQAYGVNAAERAAKKQGMLTKRMQQPDGTIRLVCEAKPQYAMAGGGYGSGY